MKKNDKGIYEKPSLYDVAGSADFRNQTHDGFCIYRYFGDENYTTFTNLKTKYSFQGEIGKELEFNYHIPSGRYYEVDTKIQTNNLLLKHEPIQEKENLPFINPVDAFGNSYDENSEVPF
jgi:twinkle protein